MTCGACAARIERRLNRLDGVAATVNYATGRAYFTSTGGREPAELIGVIKSAATPRNTPPRRPRTARPAPTGDPGAGPAAHPVHPAGRGGHRAVDGAGRAVLRLAVGEPSAGPTGRHLGSLAAVPGRVVRARLRRRHHGHPGHARAVGFVYSWSRVSATFASLMINFLLIRGGAPAVAAFIAAAMVVMTLTIGGFGPKTRRLTLEEISQ